MSATNKNKEQCVRDIIYNDDSIVKYVSQAPQTFNSFLGKEFKDVGTFQTVLRRRISRLVKNHKLLKLRVPGTRFGLMILCTPQHNYKILVHKELIGKTKIYYLYKYKTMGDFLLIDDYWQLQGPNWSKWVFCDDTLKISIRPNRSDVVILWE